jgi:class 3 adenylate cyclase/tetratricopeptide (TPR) repeat protein
MAVATARTVTVLFTDLVASTELTRSLPASSADEVRRAHFAALEQAVASTGGSVVKSLGDGLMVSYESVAQALAGAVAMQRAVARHNRRPKQPTLAMRVGLSVGEATSEDGDWFGPPVIEAARLCAEAEGGQILTTDVVRALVGNRSEFRIKPMGLYDLKGLPDSVPVCEVAWQEHVAAPVGLPVGLTLNLGRSGFVGREDELARLTEGWERARSGERQLLLVAGEPGIGKTRLVAELALRAHGAGATVLFGRCYEETLTPYQPFVEAFAGAGLELGELVPVTLAGSSLGPALSQGGPESNRYLLFEAVTKVLANLADDAAVVMVLDDLHWADKATLLLLEYLARTARPMAVLIVGTYRETDLARDHPLSETLADLRRERLYERIMLRGLDREELGAFVADRAGQEAPPVFVDALYAETEGNPFFAGEVLLHLVESGAIYVRDGRWRIDVTSVDQLGIPEGVRDAIGRRLSRLSKTTNRVLAVASVLGREFSLSVVEAVSDVGTEDLLNAVDQASAARLIAELPGDPDRYGFTHALIRQTLYGELGGARRLRLHQRAGGALEARYGADVGPHLGELAYHFAQLAYGGDVDKAVDYCARAAERAAGLMAFEEAAEHYRRALQVLEVAERGGDARECDLRIALTDALKVAADFVRGYEEAQRAIELARRLGDDHRFAAAVAATPLGTDLAEWQISALNEALVLSDIDPVVRARLLTGRARSMAFVPTASEAERDDAGREAVAAARALGDPVELLWALFAVYLYARHSPDLGRAAELADEQSALAATTRHPGAQDAALAAQVSIALGRGDISECRRAIDTARATGESSSESDTAYRSTLFEATLALLQGRFSEAEAAATRALAIGRPARGTMALMWFGLWLYALRRDQGRLAEMETPLRALLERSWDTPALAPALHAGLAYLYLETDRLDQAAVELERILDDGRYRRLDTGVITVAYLSEVAAALGHRALAAELYERLVAYDGQTVVVDGPSYCNGAVARYLGLLAACLGRTDDAERHFNDALSMNERIGARPWVARTKLDFAHLLAARDTPPNTVRARQLADDSLSISEEIGMPALRDRARRLADSLLQSD